MSVHKNLDTPIGHGPHHFAPDTIGLKGPAARRISAQLSQTNGKKQTQLCPSIKSDRRHGIMVGFNRLMYEPYIDC